MNYFSVLSLNREPFSNTPDPDFFFHSRQHVQCLQKIELSIRLRRGLNVVIGEVGTGKTTLCRQLIRRFARDETIETHLILDPAFSRPLDFLSAVSNAFHAETEEAEKDPGHTKEAIKKYLFAKGVEGGKAVVLIVDEGQKIPSFGLEILRELLNYETNQQKLLQIVIFAQREFEKKLRRFANLTDRISLYHLLGPMTFRDTRAMIRFRMDKAGSGDRAGRAFTYPALWAVYRHSRGFPRKIINLCHACVLASIIRNRERIDWFTVRSCALKMAPAVWPTRPRRRRALAALVGLTGIGIFLSLEIGYLDLPAAWSIEKISRSIIMDRGAERPLRRPVEPASVSARLTRPKAPPMSPAVDLHSREVEWTNFVKDVPVAWLRPESLGAVSLQPKESISWLAQQIYGNRNGRLPDIMRANPEVKDFDRVPVGESIRFPAKPITVIPWFEDCWWLVLGETEELEAAVELWRRYNEQVSGLRMVPYWSKQEGLRFPLVCLPYGRYRGPMERRLAALPAEARRSASVRNLWREDRVFFADPFAAME
ncbi:MAG: AAA family ATPase [Proteobacteria bacterium]|nr:AAA family ATPase [Pseudomonadota bacterium]